MKTRKAAMRTRVGSLFGSSLFGAAALAAAMAAAGSARAATPVNTETFKLTASDAAANDGFGNSVAISGNTAIVGARRDDGAVFGSLFPGGVVVDSGSAYLFDAATGAQRAKLTASDAAAGDLFGNAVAISGNTAIVGAYLDDNSAGFESGSAYLFDVTTGPQVPEPATGVLLVLGALALGRARRSAPRSV